MTDVVSLPERVDSTTIDVGDLVGRVAARAVVLDWTEVTEADISTLRSLLSPFLDRMEEFEDALGVMTMPESIEPAVNHVVANAPLPKATPAAWVVIQSHGSKYADKKGQHYEYPPRIPNGRRVSVGDSLVCCLPKRDATTGGRIFGIGTIGEIVEVDDRVRAVYADYVAIDPPLSFEQLGGDPRPNPTNSINRVPMSFAERVRAAIAENVETPAASTPTFAPDLDLSNAEGVRNALHELVALDLLGPACGPDEELIADAPRTRYVAGTLAPRDAPPDQLSLDDRLEGAGEGGLGEGNADGPPPASTTLFSSSIGLTFVVADGVESVTVVATWGAYERRQSELHFTDRGDPRMVWRRRQRGKPFELALTPGRVRVSPDPECEDVIVEGLVRPSGDDGTTIVTLFLVNAQATPPALEDSAWVFQPQLTVRAVDRESAIFVRRDHTADLDAESGDPEAEERAILGMTHRKHAEFAVGHGVAVHAEAAGDPWVDDTGWERATEVSTAVLPWYDVPITETPNDDELAERFPSFEGFALDMAELAAMDQDVLVTVLRRIPETYTKWIEEQRSRLDIDPGLANHHEAANRALEKAEHTRDRLAEGVRVIESDKDAFNAFRFANRAMRSQRLRSIYALQRRRGEEIEFADVEASEPTKWRAFQLAFVLLNIPTITRVDHPKRTQAVGSYADLLWFPTGGGKTEAYLGVAAYSIAIRRLQGRLSGHEGDGGVSVIMRYTLRLLTLQQFQRAATLVCAMEQLRLEDGPDTWGHEPFRIGLWVGGSSTPNTTFESNKWVNEHRGAHEWESGGQAASPLQLTNCPWCGSRLRPDNVAVELYKSGRGRTFLHCRGRDCAFSKRQSIEGIPVLTVDEEIYRLLPTFLLATVDKFAQMPWRGDVQALFGRVVAKCERHGWLGTERECSGVHTKKGSLPAASLLPAPPNGFRPPDLVIQDELHLISGPLGTLVGLYETAVDELCTWEHDGVTVRPKVIASTATTRRAAEQVHHLFCRQVELFPPAGLDADDNFFSRQRPPSAKPGRRYMGVCAPGRSRPSVLIRVYVAVLTAAQWLWNQVDENQRELVDPYMTLLGYFNSLRELGGMRRLVDDDVSTRTFRIEREDRPGLAQRTMYPDGTQELTSRIRSSRIPDLLDQLEVPFPPRTDKGHDGKWPARPLDVVLATNMVSVGVDVQRLGLMVVSGQPKATAEYIQATSRVGRSHPGLVVTVLNWARPRDLSHYEQFEHYHAVFYRYVEALSVTPFAPRALSRGLTGVLASLIRLHELEFNPNPAAQNVKGAGQFPDVTEAIAARAQNTTFPDAEHVEGGARVRQAVTAKLDEWAGEASIPNRKLGYRKPRKKDDVTVPLLKAPGTGPWEPFTVPTSMREVEPGVGLVLSASGRDSLPAWRFVSATDGDDE